MKYTYLFFLAFLNFTQLFAQNKPSIEQYYEAYKNTYGIFDIGMNTPKGQEMEFQIFEKTPTYIKFGIEPMNLYIEMALFQGKDEWISFVILHKYYNQDFRASLQKMQCLSLNPTPIGNPLDESEAFYTDEVYAYYYQNVALMQTQTMMGTNNRKDINYQKIILPKNGENQVLLQYAKPKVQNGAIVEEMRFENGKAIVKIEAKFKTWGVLNFQKMQNYFEFEYK